MDAAEMNRRIAALTPQQIADIKQQIAEGNGAAGIAGQSQGEYFKAVNAVFQMEKGRA